jgi:glycosyltransferase involved in cell wall biosynthesis
MIKPKISIIFICYNHEAFVEEALNSALSQQFDDFEVLIADDCSTDGTVDVISRVLEVNPNAWRARWVKANRNLGISGNWSRAVQSVRGEYIVGMSGDDVSKPGRLSEISRVFSDQTEVTAVVSQVTVINKSGEVIMPRFESATRSSGLLKKSQTTSGYTFWSDAPVIGASAAYRSDLARDFGPLLAGKSEDNSYFYRALLLGSVYYIPTPLVLWRWHGRNASFGAELGTFTAESLLARAASVKEDALANCRQYYADAERAYVLGAISDKRLAEERQKIGQLEKLLSVALASEDPRQSYGVLLSAVWSHLAAERYSFQSIAFSLRALAKPLLPLALRLRLTRRLR